MFEHFLIYENSNTKWLKSNLEWHRPCNGKKRYAAAHLGPAAMQAARVKLCKKEETIHQIKKEENAAQETVQLHEFLKIKSRLICNGRDAKREFGK